MISVSQIGKYVCVILVKAKYLQLLIAAKIIITRRRFTEFYSHNSLPGLIFSRKVQLYVDSVTKWEF